MTNTEIVLMALTFSTLITIGFLLAAPTEDEEEEERLNNWLKSDFKTDDTDSNG